MPVPFAPALGVPGGQNTAVGIGKETTAGVPASPTVYHAHTGFVAQEKNTAVPRPGARRQLTETYPATGPYVVTLSMSVETDPDAFMQLVAFAMGDQSSPTETLVSTELYSIAAMGATALKVKDIRPFYPGCNFTVVGNTESVCLSIEPNDGSTPNPGGTVNVVTGLSAGAAANAGITATSSSSYISTLIHGTPLPSFSLTIQRASESFGASFNDYVLYYGCKVNGMTLSMDPKGGLTAKFTIIAIGAINQEDALWPGGFSPSFSTLYPFQFTNTNSFSVFNGLWIGYSGQMAVASWEIDVANNLLADYYSFGNGRTLLTIPEQQRKVTAKCTLGFESNEPYEYFWGAAGATRPQNVIPGIPIEFCARSSDLADDTLDYYYSIDVTLINCFIETDDPDIKPTGTIMQPLSITTGASGAGANDNLEVTFINNNSSVY
jgi:hypothetical protein